MYYGVALTALPQDVEIDAAGGFHQPYVAQPVDDNTALGVTSDDTKPTGDGTNDTCHKASRGSWKSKAENDQGGRDLCRCGRTA